MPSRLRILTGLNLYLLLLGAVMAYAQSADDFFHSGAQSYLSNSIPQAKAQVDAGLKLFPEDAKLKKLDELLKQQQQSQQSQQNQENQENQDQQDKKDDQKQEQKKQQEQQAKDQKREQEKQKQQQAKAGDKKEQKADQQPTETRQEKAGQMTSQQAQRLLDTQNGTEQVLWFKPEGKPENPDKQVKDW